MHRALLLILAGLASACWGQGVTPESDRRAILKTYDIAIQAAKLKYLDGVLSIRLGKYQIFNSKGVSLSLDAERGQVANLFLEANRVRLSIPVESFRSLDANTVICKVRHKFEVESLNKSSAGMRTTIYETRVWDEWRRTSAGWRLASTTLAGPQTRQSGGTLPMDRDLPTW